MKIDKIIQPVVDNSTKLVAKAASTVKGCVSKAIDGEGEKLLSTLDRLATNAKIGITPIKSKIDLPEFLYHMTSLENYKKILKDGKIFFSTYEGGVNACPGVYMIDKKNFLQQWSDKKTIPLLGIRGTDQLIEMTGKADKQIVAIKIPSSELSLDRLRIRPYYEMFKRAEEMFENETYMNSDEFFEKGLSISELSKYINTEPVEYIYQKEIPTSLFGNISVSDTNLSVQKIIQNLFGK